MPPFFFVPQTVCLARAIARFDCSIPRQFQTDPNGTRARPGKSLISAAAGMANFACRQRLQV
jgi:hypothetical protein